MSVTTAIRKLIAQGFSVEQALAAAEAFEAEMTPPAPIRTARQERNKRYYDSKKSSEKHLNSDVQDVSDADSLSPKKETSPEPPKEKTTPIHPKANAFGSDRDFFAEFMVAYPRREGSNPRKPARLVFERLLAKGVSPERLIAEARALALKHPTPTPYVPQAKTWLGQERFADAEPVIPGDTFCAADDPQTRFHMIRYRNNHDGHDPPDAIFGGKAGFMIPAEWVKAMQLRTAANG